MILREDAMAATYDLGEIVEVMPNRSRDDLALRSYDDERA
jgi:hypothetical protein